MQSLKASSLYQTNARTDRVPAYLTAAASSDTADAQPDNNSVYSSAEISAAVANLSAQK